MRIIVTGAKGAGKSTIGASLAKRLGIDFIDSDDIVLSVAEAEGLQSTSCAEIFRVHGEGHFRVLEHRALLEIKDMNQCVLSTGGSTLLEPGVRQQLRQRAVWIFLNASAVCLWERLRSKGIPAYLDNRTAPEKSFFERVARVQETLMPISDIVVDVENRRPDSIVDEAITQLSTVETTVSDTLRKFCFYPLEI